MLAKLLKKFHFTLLVALLATVVATLIIFSLIASQRVKDAAARETRLALLRQIALVEEEFSNYLTWQTWPSVIEKKAQEVARLSKGRVTISKKDGQIVADTSPLADKNTLFATQPLKGKEGEVLGYVRLTASADPVARVTGQLKSALFLTLILAAAIALFFSRYFAGRLAHPVGEMFSLMENKLTAALKKSSAERRQSEAILSSMTEAVLAVDKNSRVIFANPVMSKMFCLADPEGQAQTAREALRNNEIADLIDEVLKTNTMQEAEIDVFIVHVSPSPLGAVCVLHDITEIRKLEKHRSEFVANVSHELKTPLTAIRSYVETLLAGAINDQENNHKFLAKVEAHALRLSALIDDILEVSKLEAKKDQPSFAQVNLVSLIDRAIETISRKTAVKNIHLRQKSLTNSCYLTGVEEHLFRAILNLLDNAANYTNANGKIEISCISKNGQVEVSVQDNGIGIEPEHLERIFERFYRVDQARSRDLGGTGLGLSIVKHVMNLHQGKVLVESAVGQGSKFTLVFHQPNLPVT